MTQGFYEQLGVAPDAPTDAVRAAYHRQVARIGKRLRLLREQGGDTSQLDLGRAQLDEAWAVLSVPGRRQRYDAMLGFLDSESTGTNADQLWEAVGDALVPPSVAAAVALLGSATSLAVPEIGQVTVEEPPIDDGFLEASTTPTLTPETFTSAPTEAEANTGRAPVISVPRPQPVARLHAVEDAPHLKVVDGTPQASSVIVLPSDAPRQKTLTTDEVGSLTDQHGYSGGLIRAVREAKGVTLDEVAASTRISVRYLEAIEDDAHDRLPSATFVKGYVREVARLLKLDDETVVTGYMRRLQQ